MTQDERPTKERCEHETMLTRTTNNMKCDPWWWECENCEKQFVDRETLSTAEARVRELEQALHIVQTIQTGWRKCAEEAEDMVNKLDHALQRVQEIMFLSEGSDELDTDTILSVIDAALAALHASDKAGK